MVHCAIAALHRVEIMLYQVIQKSLIIQEIKWQKYTIEFSLLLQEETLGVTEFTNQLFSFQDPGRHIEHASGKVQCVSVTH
jgi:hypothetical protein